ncbi:MAG: glycosyltransferase [Gemmataceae bacterium]
MSSALRTAPAAAPKVASATNLLRADPLEPGQLSFDQWDKYQQAANHVEKLCRGLTGRVRLLVLTPDGDSRFASLFETDRVEIVHHAHEELVLDANDFDVVVAFDALRQIPPERHEFAITQMLRVSRRGVVLTEADAAVARLIGHDGSPLVDDARLRELLSRLEVPFATFDGTSADRWLAGTTLAQTALAMDTEPAVRAELLDTIMQRAGDTGPYRRYYVIAKHFDATDALQNDSDHTSPNGDVLGSAMDQIAHSAIAFVNARLERSRHEPATLKGIIRELTRNRSDFDLRHCVLLSFVDALESSRGWKLLAPLRRVKNLIRPRGFTRDNLRPWKDLDPLPETGKWNATGADPQFLVCCWLPAGWVRVRLRANVAHKSRLEIYAERDGGFDPTTLLGQFTLVAGDNDEEFFLHLDRPTRAIRIDPLDSAGEFRLDQFDLAPRPGPYTILDALRRKLRLLRAYHNTLPVLLKGLQLLFTGRWGDVARKWALGLHDPRCTRHGFYEPEKAYQRWIANHTLNDTDRAAHRDWAMNLENPPKFSVVMPTYNTPEKYLRLAIESVLRQTYPHWELCIADDGSTDAKVRTVLEEYARRDSRVKLAPPGRRGGISAATNTALALATGDFIAFLDHDDEVAEQALYRMAREIVATPDADMLYSDEDKMKPDGHRIMPFFKPDWSPEFFLGCMYTCHLSVYRTELLREVGGFRAEFDGAQDYDLALRVSEKARRVVHVPDVLYHWRLLSNSTALSVAAKPEAHSSGMRALEDHLRRTGRPGHVEVGPSAGLNYTRFAVRGTPKVSIIIPSQCRPDPAPGRAISLLENCLTSIAKRSTWANFEVIILDRETMRPAMQRKLLNERVRRVTYQQPFNWSMVNNLGVQHATGEYLLFLNDDMEVTTPAWMENLLEFAHQPGIGAVGARLVFPDGALQHVGVTVLDGKPGHPFYGHPHHHPGYYSRNLLPHNCAAVTGACLITRAEVYREAGGFDEGLPLNYNDIDFCFRVRKLGYRIVYTPHAELLHFEGASKPGVLPGEMQMFRDRWGEHAGDPYYNVNLNMETFDYRIG